MAVTSSLGTVEDEGLLVARIQANDRQAERLLYDKNVDRVYRLAYRLAGDTELARDLTQDTFIKVFSLIGTFRGESKLDTWIRSVALTTTLEGLRKRKRREKWEAPFQEGSTVSTLSGIPSQPDLGERIAKAIDELQEEFRIVFVMYEVEGFTHEEIAQALGIAPNTSRIRLFRGKQKLRDALQQFAEVLES